MFRPVRIFMYRGVTYHLVNGNGVWFLHIFVDSGQVDVQVPKPKFYLTNRKARKHAQRLISSYLELKEN